MPFTGPLVVEEIDEQFWRLRQPLEYRAANEDFLVPVDFHTDFASVPRAVVWLIPRYGTYTKAAVLHDFLLRSEQVRDADADGIFRRALHEAGVSVPRRWMMWAAVRYNSRLSDATRAQIAAFVCVALFSIVFLFVPVVVVTVYLILFWFLELLFWLAQQLHPRYRGNRVPHPDMRSA